ncbi:hypothetical protein VYU27_004183 [Nannochloropsis oceanica]
MDTDDARKSAETCPWPTRKKEAGPPQGHGGRPCKAKGPAAVLSGVVVGLAARSEIESPGDAYRGGADYLHHYFGCEASLRHGTSMPSLYDTFPVFHEINARRIRVGASNVAQRDRSPLRRHNRVRAGIREGLRGDKRYLSYSGF